MSNSYNLKKFTGIGSRLSHYFISYNQSGFVISSGFYLREGIKAYTKAVLFFDEEKKAVGIKFTSQDDAEGAFQLIHSNKGTTGSISSRSFIIANNLNDLKYYGRKTPKKINYEGEGDIFVIDLLEEKQEKTAPSASSGA